MLEDIKKQIIFIRWFDGENIQTSEYIKFFIGEDYFEIDKNLYNDIKKEIQSLDEPQFLLTYGRDPFGLNRHQSTIENFLKGQENA